MNVWQSHTEFNFSLSTLSYNFSDPSSLKIIFVFSHYLDYEITKNKEKQTLRQNYDTEYGSNSDSVNPID